MVFDSDLIDQRFTNVEFSPRIGASKIRYRKSPNSSGQRSLRYSQVVLTIEAKESRFEPPVLYWAPESEWRMPRPWRSLALGLKLMGTLYSLVC